MYKTWPPVHGQPPINLVHGPLLGPSPWTIPRDPPLIFEEPSKIYQRFKQILGMLNERNCGQFLLVNLCNQMGEEQRR